MAAERVHQAELEKAVINNGTNKLIAMLKAIVDF